MIGYNGFLHNAKSFSHQEYSLELHRPRDSHIHQELAC